MANTYTVERKATIKAPAEAVYEQVVSFHNWDAWSPWADLDPDMRQNYSGPDAGVGAGYAWSGNRKAGQGRMKITEADKPTKVAIALDFVKPFKSSNTTTFSLAPHGDTTEVTWTMVGPVTLMSRVMGVFMNMDKLIGKDFEKGLDRLKTVCE